MEGGRVTALRPQKRDPSRYSLFVDGRFFVGLSEAEVLRWSLRPGDRLTRSELAAIREEAARSRWRDRALHLLARRPHSREELRRKLLVKGCDEGELTALLDRLGEEGLVDDEEFARAFILDRLRLRPRGRWGLLCELRARGVSGEVAERALQHLWDGSVDEVALAKEVGAAWLRSLPDEPRLARQRLSDRLWRRGFSAEAVRKTVDELLAGTA